jgi:L-fuconolactonase
MPAIIDAHQHFWKYQPAEYPWIGEEMGVLHRDFLPAEFEQLAHEVGITGVVTVQARQCLEETRWLLEIADHHEFIRGVVGWVPFVDLSVGAYLEEFSQTPKLKGMRHVLQDEPDDFYMLRDDFNAGIHQLQRLGTVYDILIYERHLPQTCEFVDRHPNQVFVLDHIAKPRIREHSLSPWRERITELAKRENVHCKVSGMLTEAQWHAWTREQLAPYFDVVLSAFGPKRLLFASDWPVILLAGNYREWLEAVRGWEEAVSPSELSQILGANAVEVYRL